MKMKLIYMKEFLFGFEATNFCREVRTFIWKIKNTFWIFWAELWIRQDEFHSSLSSNSYEYAYSFLSLKRKSKGTDYLLARRHIAHNVDDEKHQFKTFILRQIAWFVFCRKNKYPSFVFSSSRFFAH